MGYGTYLRELLRPLGIYDLREGSYSGSELDALGVGLDATAVREDYAQREGNLMTAEDLGLSLREELFAHRPVQVSVPLRRAAILSLLRISGDSFTLADINAAISGCGINAKALEWEPWGHIRVIFPDVAGIPPEFEQIKTIILDIIPCHLETEFYFRYLTWEECEAKGFTWSIIEENQYTWYEFELAV